MLYFHPTSSNILTASVFKAPNWLKLIVSALNVPQLFNKSEGSTSNLTGYSKFDSAKTFCASLSVKNSNSLIAFSLFFECAVMPAPLMLMWAPLPSWLGKKIPIFLPTSCSSTSSEANSLP